MTRAEADVIDAAQNYADARQMEMYRDTGHLLSNAEKTLMDAVLGLASENDGRWNYPRKF